MNLTNVTKQDNGGYTMTCMASAVEAAYLFSFAVNMLVAAGVVHLTENPDGSPEVDQEIDLPTSSKGNTLQ